MIQERISLIAKIRKQYPDIKNITEAVRKYNEDNNENVPLLVSTKTHGNRVPNILDTVNLPKCPKCGSDMFVRPKCSGMAHGDYITKIRCTKCEYYDLSEKPIEEWLTGGNDG